MRRALAVLIALLFPLAAVAQVTEGGLLDVSPAATGFPTPSFTNSNLTSWIATSSAFCAGKDTFNTTTWTACEDLSGFGNGACQDEKPSQPGVSNGGFYFTANQQHMTIPCFGFTNTIANMLFNGGGNNGLTFDIFSVGGNPVTTFTVGVTFEIDSVLGTANQVVFDYVATGNNHKIEIFVNTAGNIVGTLATGAGNTVTGGAVSTGAKHVAIVAGDISVGTMTLYLDGVSQGTATPVGTTFGTAVEISLGNTVLPAATSYQLPLNGYITCFTAQATSQSGAAITSLNTYHSGASC
jgi:hypothetical protein